MGARAQRGVALVTAVIAAAAATAPAAGAAARAVVLGNRCFAASSASGGSAGRFYLKPTRLGAYLLYDRRARLLSTGAGAATRRVRVPGPAAEWAVRQRSSGAFVVRSTATGRALAAGTRPRALVTTPAGASGAATRFRFTPARGCRRYPEAALGATGTPMPSTRRDGTVVGFADPHVHVIADLRGGGQVISGTSFDRFGITRALGRDADVHGPDGSLDLTGNLLRAGTATGTHDTHGWPSFGGWPSYATYTHQQVYYRWLQRAWLGGLRLMVAQTVEDQPLCEIEPRRSHSCDETATIKLEVRRLRALRDYVDAQSGGRGRGWLRLVYDPAAARRVIDRGKLAVIIGVESSNPFGCSERNGRPQCDRADIDRGIARMRRIGVRSMFVAHWVDNALAGAALEGGDKGALIDIMNRRQTGDPFTTGACPEPGQGELVAPGRRECNVRSLTDLGEYAVRRLMDAGMLIEVDHLGEWARERLLTIAEQRNYPLVSSHTGTGGTWTASELRRLYALGGFASATVDDAARLPAKILAFRRYSPQRTPGVGLATDTGGFAALPGPDAGSLRYPFRAFLGGVRFTRQRTGTRTFDLNADGVAHYGLVPDLLAAVERRPRGRRALGLLFRSAEGYLRTWERASAR